MKHSDNLELEHSVAMCVCVKVKPIEGRRRHSGASTIIMFWSWQHALALARPPATTYQSRANEKNGGLVLLSSCGFAIWGLWSESVQKNHSQ